MVVFIKLYPGLEATHDQAFHLKINYDHFNATSLTSRNKFTNMALGRSSSLLLYADISLAFNDIVRLRSIKSSKK